MTATIFFSIFFSLFIFHLLRPFSESTGSAEGVGASSSSTSNLDDIKQRLVNSIKNLLDIDIEHNSDLNNNQQQQQDTIMSVPTPQPTMLPTSAGTSSTSASVLPTLNPITVTESNIIRQLNAITISLKLRDDNLYQTASTTLLNYYDNFSTIVFLANSTPINLNIDKPILKHLNDFINNMRPSQRSSSTSSASAWFICLTEEEHQHYQLQQHLQTRPFKRHQQQKPRLRNDAISALNYLIYVGSTSSQHQRTSCPAHPATTPSISTRSSSSQQVATLGQSIIVELATSNLNQPSGVTSTPSSCVHQWQRSTSSGSHPFRPATSSISTW